MLSVLDLSKRARSKVKTGRLFIRSLVMLYLTDWGLRLIGFNRWTALLDRWPRFTANRPLTEEEIRERIGRARGALRLAIRVGMTAEARRKICLRQALVLRWLLRQQGIETDLEVGVGLAEAQFEAHAWLVYQGQTLIGGRRGADLVPLDRPLRPAEKSVSAGDGQ